MGPRLAAAGRLVLAANVLMLCTLGVARAERAWVKGHIELNLRAGAGLQYRILDKLATGDAVTILERETKFTKVTTAAGQEGWIPAGYLVSEPPPKVRVERLEAEAEELRRKLTTATDELERLRTENVDLASRDDEQQSAIRDLTEENLDLKAGERWPYLIAGASILASGMLIGAILHAGSSRRQPRIKF